MRRAAGKEISHRSCLVMTLKFFLKLILKILYRIYRIWRIFLQKGVFKPAIFCKKPAFYHSKAQAAERILKYFTLQ